MYIKVGNRKLKILSQLTKYWFSQMFWYLLTHTYTNMVKTKKLDKDKKNGETGKELQI